MSSRTLLLLALLVSTAAPAAADARSDARKQVDFGIAVAQKGLWREAIYRWERAIQIDPTYAQALNNLASTMIRQGEPAAARKKDDGTETLSLAEYNERMRDPRQVHKTIAARKAGTLKIKL